MLDRARDYLESFVAANAAAIDCQPEVLQVALQGLGDRALLALRVPKAWQGEECSRADYFRFQEAIARYSGALAFLQTQHQSAGALIASGSNEVLKREFLPNLATGKTLLGIAFSHLRRPKPVLHAIETENGYQLRGQIPWITGYGFFQHCVVGATLPSGAALYGILPLQPSGDNLQFSAPLALAAMAATQTVTATLEDWVLARDRVVVIRPPEALANQDKKNVLKSSSLPLGCARAGLDVLQAARQRKPLPALENAYICLDREREDCRTAIFEVFDSAAASFEECLELRAGAIDLAGRCARAALLASGGAANLASHPAGRIARESAIFATSGQTPALLEKAIARSLSRPPRNGL